jgi:uncharacterized membrane protein YgcG
MTGFGRHVRVFAGSILGFGLVGCGIVVPDIKEAWDSDTPMDQQGHSIPGAGQIEFEIKKRIFCELEEAVQFVNQNYPVSAGSSPETLKPFAKYPIPLDWLAQISLSLQVDESSSLSPGVSLTTTLPNAVQVFGPGNSVSVGQSRSLSLGGTLSSTATRIDKFNPSYVVSYLMIPEGKNSVCRPENDPFVRNGLTPASSSPFILESDLGIKKWLIGAVITDVLIGSKTGPAAKAGKKTKAGEGGDGGAGGSGGGGASGGGGGGGGLKTDAYSYEIKFVIVSSGNVTPTWKLVQVSANTSGTFFATGRTRTHDLVITIGPNDNLTLNAHLASQIGQAVNNLRATPPQ